MGVFNKLWEILRGSPPPQATEPARPDSETIAALEREVQESKTYLSEARHNLMQLVQTRLDLERMEVGPRQTQLKNLEREASYYLNMRDEKRARQLAEQMAEVENELEVQQSLVDSYAASINELKQTIKESERSIFSIERELQVMKAMANVQRAHAATEKFARSELAGSTDALRQIRERQQKKNDQREAALQIQREHGDVGLHDKLKSAGIVSGASSSASIMDRIKTDRRTDAQPETIHNERVRWVKKNRY